MVRAVLADDAKTNDSLPRVRQAIVFPMERNLALLEMLGMHSFKDAIGASMFTLIAMPV